eukprot:14324325-Ditylum_brightwellii.AAC.1
MMVWRRRGRSCPWRRRGRSVMPLWQRSAMRPMLHGRRSARGNGQRNALHPLRRQQGATPRMQALEGSLQRQWRDRQQVSEGVRCSRHSRVLGLLDLHHELAGLLDEVVQLALLGNAV